MKGLLAGAGALAASGTLPRLLQRRAAAQAVPSVYPTIFILLRGGVDPVMHFDARTGYVNRNVSASDIRETPGGIRWYEPVLASMTNHIQDCSVIRNITCSSSHIAGYALAWYGVGGTEEAGVATPWPAYLADQLLRRQRVAAPNLVTYVVNPDRPRTDYIQFNNSAPSPLATAQRVQKIANLAGSLDVLQGMPDPAIQARVYETVDRLDGGFLSRTVQPGTTAAFSAAKAQAGELLMQPPPVVWPPDVATMEAFNLDPGSIDNTISQGNQRFEHHLALAYTMAREQLSHSVFVQATGVGWDTHQNHDARQRRSSARAFPRIERLISALKSTESPVEAGKTMLDTTHVVITSEISRANAADNGQDLDGTGTPHWPWTQAVILGGRFKRDTTFGDRGADARGIPADFATGALNDGRNPTFADLHATILKANGVDPAGWMSGAEAIGAILS